MSWIRRAGAIALAIALVVLIPAPASAVDVIAPVDPFPGIVSQLQRAMGSSTGGVGGSPTIRWGTAKVAAQKLADAKAATAARVASAASATAAQKAAAEAAEAAAVKVRNLVPVTKPAALPKLSPVVAGGPAGAALSGWFAIAGTGAAVSFVGEMVGADLDGAMCGAEDWIQTGYSVLTMGQGPSCKAVVIQPNLDSAPGVSIAGLAFTQGVYGNYDVLCGPTSLGLASGQTLAVLWRNANGVESTGGFNNFANQQVICGRTTTPYVYVNQNLRAGGPSTLLRIERRSGTQVLETSVMRSSNPSRSARCKLDWPDGTSTTGDLGSYRETDGFPVGALSGACTDAFVSKPGAGPGLLPQRISVPSTNTETGAITEIATQDVPSFSESERKGLTVGNGTGLQLLKVVNGLKVSCLTWEADCAKWWTDTANGTQEDTYKCEYGGQPIALAECGIYRQTFDTKTSRPTLTDPDTGAQTDWTSTTDPGNQFGTGGQAGQSSSQCVVSWSWNPVDWVLRPIRCAFEPRQSKVEETTLRVQRAWEGSTPGKFAASVATIGAAFDSVGAGNCRGVIVPVPEVAPNGQPTTVNRAVLAACPGDFLAPYAPTFFWLITITLSVSGVFIVKRQLDRFVNN